MIHLSLLSWLRCCAALLVLPLARDSSDSQHLDDIFNEQEQYLSPGINGTLTGSARTIFG